MSTNDEQDKAAATATTEEAPTGEESAAPPAADAPEAEAKTEEASDTDEAAAAAAAEKPEDEATSGAGSKRQREEPEENADGGGGDGEISDPPSKVSKTESSSRASSSEGDDCSGPGHCGPTDDDGEKKAAGDGDGDDADAKEEEGKAEGAEAAPAVGAALASLAAAPASAPAALAVAVAVGADGAAVAVTPGSAAPEGVPTAGSVAAPVTAAASAPPAEAELEERVGISPLYVGRVIGKGGEMVRDLQARSGCRIDLDQGGPDKIITYRGTRAKIDFAKNLVAILCQPEGKPEDLPLGEAQRKIIFVPATVIGKIIGRGGEMIRALQNASAAKIQVDHSGADPNQRQITVIGTSTSAVKAEEMVNFIAANPQMDAMAGLQMLTRDKTSGGGVWGSGPPYANMPNGGIGMTQADLAYCGQPAGGGGGYGAAPGGYGAAPGVYGAAAAAPAAAGPGGTITDNFPAAKNYMGRVIGQKGTTINDLQRRSGCDIQINQDVAPGQDCMITITGPPAGVQAARQMLQDIIEMGPNHPYAGGANQYQQQGGYGGGGYGGGGYQQQGGYGYQQPQQQGYYGAPQQGYGMAQAGAPYGQQPQAYGGYAQQQQQQAPPLPAASPWKAAQAPDGQVYYYNSATGETQWSKPAGMP